MSDFKRGPYQAESGFKQSIQNYASKLASYTPSARFIAGGRVVITINGIAAPRLSSISWRIITEQKLNKEIDSANAYELMPSSIEVAGSYSEYREPFRGPTSAFHQASARSFMFHPYMSIEVRDNLTDALLFYAGKCAVTERSEQIGTEGLMITNVSWRAISWKDEREPTIPSENAGELQQTSQNPLAAAIDTVTGGNLSNVGGVLKALF
jgi:hypothetical protein